MGSMRMVLNDDNFPDRNGAEAAHLNVELIYRYIVVKGVENILNTLHAVMKRLITIFRTFLFIHISPFNTNKQGRSQRGWQGVIFSKFEFHVSIYISPSNYG